MNKKVNTYLIVWRITSSKYQIVTGPDKASAFNNAGIGGGALGAVDYVCDVTKFFNSKVMQKALVEVKEYVAPFYWKRETIAQIRKMMPDAFMDSVPLSPRKMKGVHSNELTDFLYEKIK